VVLPDQSAERKNPTQIDDNHDAQNAVPGGKTEESDTSNTAAKFFVF